jgi:hypothetical protein
MNEPARTPHVGVWLLLSLLALALGGVAWVVVALLARQVLG